MKIRYANSMKDLIAFNHHYTATSPAQRRAAIVLRWALPSLLLFAAVVLSLLGEWQAAGLFCVAPAVVCYFIFPIIWKRSLANALRSAYREGDNKGVLGPHELELAPPDLIERTPVNENRRWLGAIERIETTPSHSFIFLTNLTAQVIPRAAVTDGDYDAFVEAVAREMEKAKREGQARI